jgi:hypothetical protein
MNIYAIYDVIKLIVQIWTIPHRSLFREKY